MLNNFEDDHTLANVARLLLAVTMFFTFPMESFVARHVVVMLFHKGDMDGRDDPTHTGEEGFEAGGFFIFNRRQSWTIGIYIAALIPALFFNDLGPVLSITGSVGGGCISYLAPGLLYLGVNGDAFLSYVHGLLQKNSNNYSNRSVTDADLPVAGDSDQKIRDNENATDLPIAGSRMVLTNQNDQKPVWYYALGFPIWCKIASTGRANMTEMRNNNTGEDYLSHSTPPHSPTDNNSTETQKSDSEKDIMVPNTYEYFTAVFFILFGTLAIVAGLTSNIWMIVTQDSAEESSTGTEYY